MKLSLIIAALRLRCRTFEGRVAGAAEFKPIPEAAKMKLPAAYVIPLDDNVGENKSQTDYWQDVTDGFAVIIVANNVDEKGQAATYDAVHTLRAEIIRALVGWQPEPDYNPIQYEGGNLLDIDRARLYYQFEFSARFELGEEDTRQWDDLQALSELNNIDIKVDFIEPGDGPDGRIEHHLNIQTSE
ncbi:hypothetical protein ACL2XG_05335 [Sodalis sp. RH24]|uniref:phage tail terminator protein n=1 Tax=unclassified Sodalis (in: enterobacteria) TaxID=2636512 RepID=UPI0039B5911F